MSLQVEALARSVSLRPPDIDRAIRLFSEGGAKAEIYRPIENLAEQGRSIIVVSSDLPGILRVSDRVLVNAPRRRRCRTEPGGCRFCLGTWRFTT